MSDATVQRRQTRVKDDDLERYSTEQQGYHLQKIKTPDDWIDRDPELIRLTGAHPLNAEPPVDRLMSSGFVTPANLHYVRNHGDVPKLQWETHKLSVEGMVKTSLQFSMDELAKMPSEELLVTLTCDGNRRKEVNMIKRTRGFNYGPCATGCALWKGVPLHVLLQECGIDEKKGKFVWFEGADVLAKGKYGTSIPLRWAMDSARDILIAYEMNNERIPPDHGFPVRLILPGFVGGRMIKWLAKIVVSDKESDSWYHYYDNKVMPASIDFAPRGNTDVWHDPNYTLYELNINSVITKPTFSEWLEIQDLTSMYKVEGYAYAGGGRKVMRVELTFDGGEHWDLCKVQYPKEGTPRHYSMYWTWCHWEVEVEVWRFLNSKEIAVRAFDSAMSTQPESIVWNPLGMLNNSWYRVRIHPKELVDWQTHGQMKPIPWIIFQHPVRQGSSYGGWMLPPYDLIQSFQQLKRTRTTEAATLSQGVFQKEISMEEVAQHCSKDDCWVVIDGAVYDLSFYAKDHPGGNSPLMVYAGKDATRAFHDIHDRESFDSKEMFRIGVLPPVKPKEVQQLEEKEAKESALNPRRWLTIQLKEKKQLTPDTFAFHFELKDSDKHKIGLPTCQHVLLSLKEGDHFIVRPYSPVFPVNFEEDNGSLKFVIKICPHGTLTQRLNLLKPGDELLVKGPTGPILYLGNGQFLAHSKSAYANRISFIAGGTGITPVFHLIRAVLQEPNEEGVCLKLLFANKTENDIILRKELDELAKQNPDRLHVCYIIDAESAPKDWKFEVGPVNTLMMTKHLFPSGDNTIALICGPPPMIEKACIPGLEELGYDDNTLFEF